MIWLPTILCTAYIVYKLLTWPPRYKPSAAFEEACARALAGKLAPGPHVTDATIPDNQVTSDSTAHQDTRDE